MPGVCAAALVLLAGTASPPAARANDNPVVLQWFEARWEDIEHRMPDFFIAGYGATWLPPISRASASASAGYDTFDRFDLGRPGAPTTYGTESGFRAAVGEFHAANGLVFIDTIMNHNSGRQTSAAFQALGGYPGFWMAPPVPLRDKLPTDNWGDFHAGVASGYLQSENPGGPRYDLLRGDLVALIDLAQESNHQFIRHPVADGDPRNIPAGTFYNRPAPENSRLYPDRALTPRTFTNPGTTRNPGPVQFTIYPFNNADPFAGDAVTENGTGLLMRWSQWMLDEFRVDGFRLDAIKHAPTWFWDTYWDAAVNLRRATPWGASVTPLSFGECVESNAFTYANYVRKDGFASRDALDLNGAGQLRDILSAGGFGSWANVLGAHLDRADDALNNGSLGMNHVFSHDNGSVGDGGSAPANPTLRQQGPTQHAYLLLRPGRAIVYHNARGVARAGGFWPRQGASIALGLNPATGAPDATITGLVRIHNAYGRGELNVLNPTDPGNPSQNDVLVFERRTPVGGGAYSGNVLVGVNDRYDAGVQGRNVLTSFAPGTRLHELTGNAADPLVDPQGQVPEVLVVGPDRRAAITVPNNRSAAGIEHHQGFVVYGPGVPAGTLEIAGAAGELPPDPATVPFARRRLNAVPIITADEFEIRLATSAADPFDPNTDDNAVFRFDQGFVDLNGNGIVDIGPGNTVVPGYEQFVTLREPLFGSGGTQGRYHQTISAAALDEGHHYLSVIAFRHREANEAPLFREFRQAVYVDREGPAVRWADEGTTIKTSSYLVRVESLDRTANRVHVMWDLPPGADPVALADFQNLASRRDRFEWRKTQDGLTYGAHRLTIVAFEISGNASVRDYAVFVDYCRVDLNADGVVNVADFLTFLSAYGEGSPAADFTGDGTVNVADFLAFLGAYSAGCA